MGYGVDREADVPVSQTDVGGTGKDAGEVGKAPEEGALCRWLCLECGQHFGDGLRNCPEDGTELTLATGDRLIGSVLAGRYEVIARVGSGGMSEVYRGRHNGIGRPVAIKVLRSRHWHDPLSVRRFHQEAEAASSLNHPNLITVFDFGVLADGLPYLIMDFVEGVSLAQILHNRGRIDAGRCIRMLVQVCNGLAHAHRRGVIHRDLKPSNVMVADLGDRQDFVKVVDFGIATYLPDLGRQAQKLTHTGEVLGSFPYLSPEQCLGKKADCRSDIYSLGCLIYEALTGQPPFSGGNTVETMLMHVASVPEPMRSVCPDLEVSPGLEAIVARALEKDPDCRHQSMEELGRDLQSASAAVRTVEAINLTPLEQETQELEIPRAGEATKRLETPHWPSKQMAIAILVMVLAISSSATYNALELERRTTLFKQEALWKEYDQEGQKAFDQDDYARAEALFSLAVKEAEKFKGHGKLLVVSLRKLGDVHCLQGRYEDAEHLDKRIEAVTRTWLAGRQGSGKNGSEGGPAAVTGDGNSDRLARVAKLCHNEGKCDIAEKLLVRALKVAEEASGPDSSHTAERLNDLAVFYMELGEYEKAEPLLKRVLSVPEREPQAGKAREAYTKVLLRKSRRAT